MAISTPPTGRGRGNRRTGASRGTTSAHRRGQLSWREDPLILRRVELASDLYHQPLTVALAAVNEWLKKQDPPQDPISFATLRKDRERALELRRERIALKMEQQVEFLWEVAEDARRRGSRIPDRHGQAWAAVAAVAIRAVESVAKLTGTWNADKTPIGETAIVTELGLSPREKLELGLITQAEYLGFLQVISETSTSGQQAPLLHSTGADETNTAMVPVVPPPARPIRPTDPAPMRGARGDALPNELLVVDWQPDDED